MGYSISASILICIGLSHLPYYRNFKGFLAYFYFTVELIILAIAVALVLHFLQIHVLNQEVIRAANESRKNRYNINKQIQKQFKPGVIKQVKKRIYDVIFEDPEEVEFYTIKENERLQAAARE